MSWKRLLVALIVVLVYLIIAGVIINDALNTPVQSVEERRDLWTRVGIGLTATGVFVTIIVNLFTLSTQISAAKELEEKKKDILLAVEGRKKELSAEIASLQGQIARQNEFLKQTISAKSVAYDKILVASTLCYRELQELAKGKYDPITMSENEKALREAEALAANLDDDEIKIVEEIVQGVINIIDEVEEVKGLKPKLTGQNLVNKYEAIWKTYAKPLGKAIDEFRKRSIYRNKNIELS